MSAPAAAPVLVYDRVAANRRATWLLLLLSAVLLLPVALPASEYLALWCFILLGPVVSNIYVGIAMGAAALLAILIVEYLYAAKLVLFSARARPLAEGEHDELRRIVENLSIGCGMPPPAIYLIDTPALNALSIGLNPKRAALVVTSGLLSRLDYREVEAVAAHELAHIRNHDTRLGTLLAAVVATFWLPARIVRGIFDLLYFIHPALWIAALLWWGFMFAFGIGDGLSLLSEALVHGEWIWVVAMAASGYVVFGSPLLAVLLRRLTWQQREELADAEAVLLTRYPPALESALAKIAANSSLAVNPATAHLFVGDPLAGSSKLFDRLFSAHPPMDERIALIARQGTGVDQQEAAAQIARLTPPVSVAQILLAVEVWPRKVYAALVLLFGPAMLMLARGFGFLMWMYDSWVLAPAVLAVWVVLRWRASRDYLNHLLEGPLFTETGGQR